MKTILRDTHLMIGKNQCVGHDNILPSRGIEDDHFCDVVRGQRLTATIKGQPEMDWYRAVPYAYTASAFALSP